MPNAVTEYECPTCYAGLKDDYYVWYGEKYCDRECAEDSCFSGINPDPVRKLPPR